ncbi:hypothetical protein Salat_2507000 [Sesamum alatum]|uniref:Uncharacterized protein n=1 Tax=Sesamum alatum TaxID=300844 RepID=A0AAE1XRU1_9LAMI|nr:hypothetical protein Salat_2507000 [Sesamum alatum]
MAAQAAMMANEGQQRQTKLLVMARAAIITSASELLSVPPTPHIEPFPPTNPPNQEDIHSHPLDTLSLSIQPPSTFVEAVVGKPKDPDVETESIALQRCPWPKPRSKGSLRDKSRLEGSFVRSPKNHGWKNVLFFKVVAPIKWNNLARISTRLRMILSMNTSIKRLHQGKHSRRERFEMGETEDSR